MFNLGLITRGENIGEPNTEKYTKILMLKTPLDDKDKPASSQSPTKAPTSKASLQSPRQPIKLYTCYTFGAAVVECAFQSI